MIKDVPSERYGGLGLYSGSLRIEERQVNGTTKKIVIPHEAKSQELCDKYDMDVFVRVSRASHWMYRVFITDRPVEVNELKNPTSIFF